MLSRVCLPDNKWMTTVATDATTTFHQLPRSAATLEKKIEKANSAKMPAGIQIDMTETNCEDRKGFKMANGTARKAKVTTSMMTSTAKI